MDSAAFFTNCFVRLSLTVGASPSTVAGPTGNGSWTSSMIRSKSRCRFADLSCFESCSASVRARSSSPYCSRTASTIASRRAFSSSMSRLARTCISRTMSSSVESIVSGGASSAAISSTALGGDAVADAVGVLGDLGIDIGIDPLRLADLAAELLLRLAELLDLTVRQLERLEEQLLGHLLGAGLDHRQAFTRADNDEIHLR